MKTNTQGGVTLIELMVAVAIVSILAMIAIGSYSSQMRKKQRNLAKSYLVNIQTQQEAYKLRTRKYSTTLAGLGYAAETLYVSRGKDNLQATAPSNASYSITLDGASAIAYTLIATPLNAQLKDTQCLKLSIDQYGNKDNSASGTSCW